MNLKKYCWLAILPIAFTACQDDMLVEDNHQGITTLTASMQTGADSRAQIILNSSNSNKETFHWNKEDKFTMFQLADGNNTLTKHVFEISGTYSDDKPTAQADFSTSSALTPGCEFVAFYPACTPDTKGGIQLSIDNVLPTNDAASWKSYFMNNMFMKTRVGTVGQTSADTQVNFEQLCGIIRIKYTNASNTDRTFKRIGVNGRWTTGRYYIVSKTEQYDENNSSIGWLGVEFESKATVNAGETQNFYILFFSNGVDGEVEPMSQVIVDLDNKTTLVTPAKQLPQFKAGECYWLNITDTGSKLLWTNDNQGGGNNPSGNEIAEVSDYTGLVDALNAGVKEIVLKNHLELLAPVSVNSNTIINLNEKTLSLGSGYSSKVAMDAVFIINAKSLIIRNGNINGKDGQTSLHDYYFKLDGTQSHLTLEGVSLNTGSAITNAVYMNDDCLNMSSIWDMSEDGTKTEVPSRIQTTTDGHAIHYVANGLEPILESNLDGVINGDVYVKSEFAKLNAKLIFKGTINGNLVTELTGGAIISNSVLKADDVQIGEEYKSSWAQAGRYVADQYYKIAHDPANTESPNNGFMALKAALENPQAADEMTRITLKSDIVLIEPITIEKPVKIDLNGYTLSLSESFVWGSSDAALISTKGLFGINNGSLNGCTTTVNGDMYLLKNTSNELNLGNIHIDAKGVKHAVKVENSLAFVQQSSTISVADGGYAIDALSSTSFAEIRIMTNSQITGDINFVANYQSNEGGSYVFVQENSTLDGEVIVSGTYSKNVEINIPQNTAGGEGLDGEAIAQLLNDFS